MSDWLRERRFRRANLDDMAILGGDHWATVWRKLEIEPLVHNGIALGTLEVNDHTTCELVAQTKYNTEDHVAKQLQNQIGFTTSESYDFLLCNIGLDDAIERIRERFLATPDQSS